MMHHKYVQLEELNCSICQEKFGDNNSSSPRILSCGHTFCTRCLKSVVRQQPQCPDCRVHIQEANIEKIPVVYIVKQIIESIRLYNELQDIITPSGDCNEFESKSMTSLIGNSDLLPSVGTCPSHKAPQQFYCQSCQLWICGSCAFLDHSNYGNVSLSTKKLKQEYSSSLNIGGLKPGSASTNSSNGLFTYSDPKQASNGNGKCAIVSAVTQFEVLKANEMRKLDDQMEELATLVVTGDKFHELIQEEIESLSLIRKSEGKTLEIFDNISKSIANKKIDLQESMNVFSAFKKNLNAKSLKDLYLASASIDDLYLKYLYPYLETGIFNIIINKAPQVLMRITSIITSLKIKDKYVYSPVKFENGNMMVASLKEGPFEGIYIVPEIKGKSKNMRAFLRLGRQGRKLGMIEVKLFDNRRAEQFVMLCTGEKGPSYKWTKFFASGGLFTQFVAGGDYEKNDGTAGAQILANIGDPYGIMMQDGIICGEISFNKSQLGQFKIFYKVGSSPFAHCPIGLVVNGLSLIEEIAQQDCTKVYIEECGILVPIKD